MRVELSYVKQGEKPERKVTMSSERATPEECEEWKRRFWEFMQDFIEYRNSKSK